MESAITNWEEAAERLLQGHVGVLPTDTLYGVVGSALRPEVVNRIYTLRRRELHKPLIVLIGSMADLPSLKLQIDDSMLKLFSKVWPGPVSIIVPQLAPDMVHLHRGTQSLAIRLPHKPQLQRLLHRTGPLVAPSANMAGETPSQTVHEAYNYFGDAVFYVDEARLDGAASALVDARTNPLQVLRPAPGLRL